MGSNQGRDHRLQVRPVGTDTGGVFGRPEYMCAFPPSVSSWRVADGEGTALWNTFPPHDNYGILSNVHKQAILDVAYSLDSEVIYSVCPIVHSQPCALIACSGRSGWYADSY